MTGKIIPHYRILPDLGEAGKGIVYPIPEENNTRVRLQQH